jgi:AcrR family transcriptional regulator
MAPSALPAHQVRSRRTLERLLRATVEVLDRHGLEGATIPQIAAHACLTPGSVYRRFPDKHTLLREAFLRVLRDNATHSASLIAAESWRHAPLAALVRQVVTATLRGHARHRELLRALMIFSLEHADAAFRRTSAELQESVFRTVTEVLLERRADIGHPDPESAVPFALLMVGVAAKGVLTMPRDPKQMSRLVPDVEARLERELPEMVLNYLQIPGRTSDAASSTSERPRASRATGAGRGARRVSASGIRGAKPPDPD